MTDDFQRVKEKLPLKETVLSLTGLNMKGQHLERCPFCEHQGCFSFKDDGFRCFSCDAKGDIFNFLEGYEGLTLKDALERAAELAEVPLTRPDGPPSPTRGEGRKAEPPSVRDKIFASAADYYHSHAYEDGGRAYFIEARRHAERTVATLRAGWSDGKLLDHLMSLGFPNDDILASGLIVEREKQGFKNLDDFFFNGLAIYPHYSQGKVVHFTCKDPAKKYELQLPKKYRTESWAAYNEDQLYKKGEIILVEGENDLMSLFDAGIHHVVALCGNPSDERLKRIVSHCSGRHVYLCFDNDEGGQRYVRKFAHALAAAGAHVRIMTFDCVKDMDDYLRAFPGDRHREVKRLQNEALDLLTWEIRQAAYLDGLEAKHRHFKEHGIYKALAELGDLEQEIFIDKIVKLGFTPKAVNSALEVEDDLLKVLYAYYEEAGGVKHIKTHTLAEKIHKWFLKRGKFFHGKDGKAYLFYNKTFK